MLAQLPAAAGARGAGVAGHMHWTTTPCATFVLRALPAITRCPPPTNVSERRRLWDRADVADDELSSVVLAASRRPAGPAGGEHGPPALRRRRARGGPHARQIRTTAWSGGLPATVWDWRLVDPIRVPPETFRLTSGDHAGLYSSILHDVRAAPVRRLARRARRRRPRLGADPPSRLEPRRRHPEPRRELPHGQRVRAPQTAVLDAITDRLGDRVTLLAGTGDDRRIFSTLMELEGHLDALRTNIKPGRGPRREPAPPRPALCRASPALRRGPDAGLARPSPSPLRTTVRLVPAAPSDGSSRTCRTVGDHHAPPGARPDHRAEAPRDQRGRRLSRARQVVHRRTGARPPPAVGHGVPPRTGSPRTSRPSRSGTGSARRRAGRTHPPVEVSALLRASGRTERFSRTDGVRDVGAIKAARAEQALAERAQLEAAWNLLDTGGPVRLSSFGRLDHNVFEQLLELLCTALASVPSTSGTRRTTATDGKIEIVLRQPTEDAIAQLTTPRGRFSGPDHELLSTVSRERRYGHGDRTRTAGFRCPTQPLAAALDPPPARRRSSHIPRRPHRRAGPTPTPRPAGSCCAGAADEGGFLLEEHAEGVLPSTRTASPRTAASRTTAATPRSRSCSCWTASTAWVTVEKLRMAADALLDRFPPGLRGTRGENGAGDLTADAHWTYCVRSGSSAAGNGIGGSGTR